MTKLAQVGKKKKKKKKKKKRKEKKETALYSVIINAISRSPFSSSMKHVLITEDNSFGISRMPVPRVVFLKALSIFEYRGTLHMLIP